jgi:predicted acetyltransferase
VKNGLTCTRNLREFLDLKLRDFGAKTIRLSLIAKEKMQQIKEIQIGTETDFAAAIVIDLGIPGAPKIVTLAAQGTVTQDQKLELLQAVEQYCFENSSDYSLIAKESIGFGFQELVGQLWAVEHVLYSYQFGSENFVKLHQKNPEKLENFNSESFLEYVAELHEIQVETATDLLKSLQEKWQRFSSTVYVQTFEGHVVSAAEVHTQNNGFSIDMLGTVESQKNKGHATLLYSSLIAQILEHNLEHVGVTDSDNQPMQKIFQKLGGVLQETQITWSWSPVEVA